MNTNQLAISFASLIADARLWNVRLNETIAAAIEAGIPQKECSAQFTRQWKIAYPGYDFTSPKNNSDDARKTYDCVRTRISRAYKAHDALQNPVPEVDPTANSDVVTVNDAAIEETAAAANAATAYDAAYALVMETLKQDAAAAFAFIQELSAVHGF